jgi:ring-1,2-phenylacetyl-CoA epoxidase subunit PaaC
MRLGNGTDESHRRTQQAVNELWSFTGDLFTQNEVDKLMMQEEVIPNVEAFYADWLKEVKEVFQQARLAIPEIAHQITGGINALHTEHLGHILCEMQYLQRAYPDAEW